MGRFQRDPSHKSHEINRFDSFPLKKYDLWLPGSQSEFIVNPKRRSIRYVVNLLNYLHSPTKANFNS